jgi:hypothetical protein
MRIPLQSRLKIVLFGLIIIAGLLVLPAAAGYPTMSSMTPQIGMQGTNVPITITGYNFEPNAWVHFEDYPNWQHFMTVMNPSVSADGQTITFTLSIPQGAPSGYWDVFVSNPNNMYDGRRGWFITGGLTPTFTSIDGPHGTCQGCTISTSVSGSNFMYGATVTFSGHTGSAPSASSVSISGSNYGVYLYVNVDVPADAATGTWTMTITNPNGGGSVTIPDAFTVTVPPVITSITPDSGKQGETVPFTINGSGFQQGPDVYCSYNCGEYGLDVSDITVSGDGTTVTGTITIPSDAYTECAYRVMFYNPYENGGGYAEVPFTVTPSGLGSCSAVILDTDTILNGADGALDVDTGSIGDSTAADILWSEVKSMDLGPVNNAKMIYLGLVDFDAITINDLVGYSYGDIYISDNDIASDLKLEGNPVFAVQTNLHNFTKVQVNFLEGSALGLHLVTYSLDACQQDALNGAGGNIPATGNLLVSDIPIPAGTDLYKWGSRKVCNVGDEDAWLFHHNPTPQKNYESAVTYYLVSVSHKTVVGQCESTSPAEGIKMHLIRGVRPVPVIQNSVQSTGVEQLLRTGTNSPGGGGGGGGLLYGASGTSQTCDSSQINCDHCWALLVSGGYDPDNNNAWYYQDMSAMYQTLINPPYCYPKSQIYVLMSDGTSSNPDQMSDTGAFVDSDPTFGLSDANKPEYYLAATRANLDWVLTQALGRLTGDDTLFIFTTNHGGMDPETRLWLWTHNSIHDSIYADEFANELPKSAKTIVMTMEQCFSGGFLKPFITDYSGTQNRVIATAASATEPSNLNYFSYYWINGVGGPANNLVPPSGSGDNDKLVEMKETFDFAKYKDPSAQPDTPANLKETPQYGDTPSNPGLTLALTSCSKCADPKPLPVQVCPACVQPKDPDNDGMYEDLNGVDGFTPADVILYFNQMDTITTSEPICAFDTNGNGRIDFADVINLWKEGGF